MRAQQDNDDRQDLVPVDSDWDSDEDPTRPLSQSNRIRLTHFLQQNGVEINDFSVITKETYSEIKRIDVMDAADNWAFVIENNIRKLLPRMFVYLVMRTYDHLTVINLSYEVDFENASIYSDMHECHGEDRYENHPNNRMFAGNFVETSMLRALATCRQLKKISLCTCLVPTQRDDNLAHIFKANKNLVHLRLMGYRLSGKCLLSIRRPRKMASLFMVNCWIDRKYLLRGLRRMKKLNVLSLKSTEISTFDQYTKTQKRISKLMKTMWLDWFDVLSDYLPLYLFEKQRLNCLSVLSIDYVGNSVDDHAMEYIADNCKKLQVFSSKECWYVSGQGFVPIFKLPRLRYINVSRTNITDDAVQEEVSRDLRVLICQECHFTSEGLKTLVMQLDNFEVVDALKCGEVDNDFIAYLSIYSKNIAYPALSVTARVTSTAVNLQHMDFAQPITNLTIITEDNVYFELDYRIYLGDRPVRRWNY